MNQISFGTTDLNVSALGLGCSCIGVNGKKQAFNTLRASLDAGVNFYDTADCYGEGQSERLLGQAFKKHREQVIFATKAGYRLSSAGSLLAKAKPVLRPLVRMMKPQKRDKLNKARGSLRQQDFSRDYLMQSVEDSLRRLQTDYLDLFQLHSPPTEIIRQGEVLETLKELQQQGKLRYFGVSCETIEDALLCMNWPGLSALQVEINLLNQQALAELLPTAKHAGIAIIARQPFASGQLFTASDELVGSTKLEHYRHLAGQFTCPFSHLALKFVSQLDGVSVVIARSSTHTHLINNFQAFKSKPLTSEQMNKLREKPAT